MVNRQLAAQFGLGRVAQPTTVAVPVPRPAPLLEPILSIISEPTPLPCVAVSTTLIAGGLLPFDAASGGAKTVCVQSRGFPQEGCPASLTLQKWFRFPLGRIGPSWRVLQKPRRTAGMVAEGVCQITPIPGAHDLLAAFGAVTRQYILAPSVSAARGAEYLAGMLRQRSERQGASRTGLLRQHKSAALIGAGNRTEAHRPITSLPCRVSAVFASSHGSIIPQVERTSKGGLRGE